MQTIPSQDQLNRIENRLNHLTQLVGLLLEKVEEEGIFQKLVKSERFQKEMKEDLEAFKKDPHNLPTCMRYTDNKKHHDLSSPCKRNRIEKDFLRITPVLMKKNKRLCGRFCERTQKEVRQLTGQLKRCIRTSGN